MVEIPDDVAKAHALRLRALGTQGSGTGADAALADLLDPKPRTLRDEVIAAVESVPVSHVDRNRVANAGDFAGAVLAVVGAHVESLRAAAVGDERDGVWEEGYSDACHDLLLALRGTEAPRG